MAYAAKKEHDYKRFQRAVTGAERFDRAVLLCGSERYLTDWATNALIKRFVNPNTLSMDCVNLYAPESSPEELRAACETFPLASERKLVVLRDFLPLEGKRIKAFDGAALNDLIEYASSPAPQTLLVITAGEIPQNPQPQCFSALCAKCDCYEFKRLNDRAVLDAFIEKRFRAEGKRISRRLLDEFVYISGYLDDDSDYELYRMANDIKKIACYCGEDEIGEEALGELISGNLDHYIFHFTDAVSSGKKDEAYRIFSNIMLTADTGERSVFPLLAAMVSQFELILDTKELSKRGLGTKEIAKKLGKKSEYPVQKAAKFAKRYETGELKRILLMLYAADREIKSGGMSERLAMESFMARL